MNQLTLAARAESAEGLTTIWPPSREALAICLGTAEFEDEGEDFPTGSLRSRRLPACSRVVQPSKGRMSAMRNTREPYKSHGTTGKSADHGQLEASEVEPNLKGSFADDGVDLTLTRWMLRRSPTERLRPAQDLIDATRAMRTDSET